MKRIFAFILLLLVLSRCAFTGVIFTDTCVTMESGNIRTGVGRWGLMVDSKYFRHGATGTGGTLKKLDNPYSASSLGLYYSVPSRYNKVIGSSVVFGPLSLSSFMGERSGVGAEYAWGRGMTGAYWFKGGKDQALQKEAVSRQDRDTLYLLLGAEGKRTECLAMVSCAVPGVVSSYFSIGARSERIAVKMAGGTLQGLFSSPSPWRSHVEIRIGAENVSVAFSCLMGRNPSLVNEFRSISFSQKGIIRIGETVFETGVERSFLNGRDKTALSVSLSGKWWKLTYSTSEGVALSVKLGNAETNFRQGGFDTKVVMEREGLAISFTSRGETVTVVEM